jgi:phosphatidylinositol kinase/protein kinase (PI-3  family)
LSRESSDVGFCCGGQLEVLGIRSRHATHVGQSIVQESFEADFVTKKPTMNEYIHKLRRWRDKFEEKLDRR